VKSGAVLVEIRTEAGRIAAANVNVQRPRLAPLLVGRSATSVASLVPQLYAVCAGAQGAAINAALSAARGDIPATQVAAAVRAEAAGEQVLALLTGVAQAFAARLRRAIADPGALLQILENVMLKTPLREWLSFESFESLRDWAEAKDSPLAEECRRRVALAEPAPHADSLLPVLEAADGLADWPVLTEDFAGAPSWMGRAAETGATARLGAHPLVQALAQRPFLQHWIARLIELAGYAAGDSRLLCGRVSAVRVSAGRGRAAVETARGTLLHEVTLDGARVLDYVIVAPTEWNFQPNGAVRHWLEGMPSASGEVALALAKRAVEALDPCVECRYAIA